MKFAYLILCHTDPEHVARLARKLARDDDECGVFIHVDAKSDIYETVVGLTANTENVHVLTHRIPVYWAGFSAIDATYLLLHRSYDLGYDRFILLQGAEYPLASAKEIATFFAENPETEFIRAIETTNSPYDFIRLKPRVRCFRDRVNLTKKVLNHVFRNLPLFRLPGRVTMTDGSVWPIYWGSAQFAVTRQLVRVFLRHEHDAVLRKYFGATHASDETWFQTMALNSDLRYRTPDGGPMIAFEGIDLVDILNLTYFEYPTAVTVFDERDFERLESLPHLFIRKVTTAKSTKLLDHIDRLHAER
jgi:hypothetical protein